MRGLLIAIFISLFLAQPVKAHPHVFITPQVIANVSGHFVSQLNVEWYFDDMSSTMIFEGAGVNSNIITPTQEAAVKNLALPEAQQYSYYTHIEIDGSQITGIVPENFKVSVVDGNRLCCKFTVNVNQNVDRSLKIWFNDPTIYNEFDTDQGTFNVYDSQSGTNYTGSKLVEGNIDKLSLTL